MHTQKRRCNPILLSTISFLVLALVVGVVWAATYYSSGVIGDDGGIIRINEDARIRIHEGALSAYLDEKGLDSVEITVEMTEFFDENGNFDGAMFVFGPSGAHFDPPLKLQLRGKYLTDNLLLFDENGEALEYRVVDKSGDVMVFAIPHFSSYSYDHYDY